MSELHGCAACMITLRPPARLPVGLSAARAGRPAIAAAALLCGPAICRSVLGRAASGAARGLGRAVAAGAARARLLRQVAPPLTLACRRTDMVLQTKFQAAF